MKRTEEQKRNMTNEGRKAFYMSFVSKLDSSKVYEPVEINTIVEEVVKEQGGSPVHRSQYLNNLMKIIGEDKYEVMDDESVKTRGRSRKYLFSLKADKKMLYQIIDEYFKPKRSTAEEKPVARELKAEPKEISEEKSQPENKEGNRLSSRIIKSADKLWTILGEAIRKKKSILDFEEIGKMLGMSYHPTRAMFEKWIEYLKEVKIHIEYIYKSDGRTTQIVLKNPTNSLMNLAKEMEKYGKKYDLPAILKMRPVETTPKAIKPDGDMEKLEYSAEAFKDMSVMSKKALWHIAGILMEYNKPLDLIVIGKKLHEEFGIDLSGSQIRTLIMKTNAIQILKTGPESKIQLRETANDGGREAYEFLKSSISPSCSKSKTLARLGMTLEEVREYLPESYVESEITPKDNIFQIVFNSTRRDTLMLSILVMGCRGTDKFFDKGIIEFARRRISNTEELLKKYDPDYRIENL